MERGKDGLEELWVNAAGWDIFTRASTAAGSGSQRLVLVHGLSVSSRYMVQVQGVTRP